MSLPEMKMISSTPISSVSVSPRYTRLRMPSAGPYTTERGIQVVSVQAFLLGRAGDEVRGGFVLRRRAAQQQVSAAFQLGALRGHQVQLRKPGERAAVDHHVQRADRAVRSLVVSWMTRYMTTVSAEKSLAQTALPEESTISPNVRPTYADTARVRLLP